MCTHRDHNLALVLTHTYTQSQMAVSAVTLETSRQSIWKKWESALSLVELWTWQTRCLPADGGGQLIFQESKQNLTIEFLYTNATLTLPPWNINKWSQAKHAEQQKKQNQHSDHHTYCLFLHNFSDITYTKIIAKLGLSWCPAAAPQLNSLPLNHQQLVLCSALISMEALSKQMSRKLSASCYHPTFWQ